jgi:probable F420-dependent oxidoreductase
VKPFRFAAGIPHGDPSAIIEAARRAEALGYSSLLIPDHLFDQVAPLTALAAVGAVTDRLRLGPFVLNNDLRHPVVVAQELATIDLISAGRLEIGMGAGWNEPEYRTAGIAFDPAGRRIERLAEAVTIMKGVFGDGAFGFSGRHYEVAGMERLLKPAQRPHPPFLMGGGGKRMLSLAAVAADIVGLAPRLGPPGRLDLNSVTAEGTDEKIGWIRAAAGERFESLEINTYPCFDPVTITSEPLKLAGELAKRLNDAYSANLSAQAMLESPHVFFGTVKDLVEKCLVMRERFGISYVFAGSRFEDFAPVVERLAGT